jgi:pSer/pThr/pTyr-binding forkhead associated (FHA) protein
MGYTSPVEGENVIGRDEGCAIRIDAARVSRRHACIRVSGSGASIQDLGSKNGTYVRGRKLTGTADLRDGDEIGIGGARFTFRAAYGPGTTITG